VTVAGYLNTMQTTIDHGIGTPWPAPATCAHLRRETAIATIPARSATG
jgi:hypothetical protein